jgi:hypothetical protein
MSGRQQDKSPAEQRAEITKLAAREGCSIVAWYTDEAITGLIYYAHCGQPMYGGAVGTKNHNGQRIYRYAQYCCATYGLGSPRNTTCGHFTVDAQRVLAWLVQALQEEFLGPGRDTLVQSRGSYRRKPRPTSATWRDSKRGPRNWTGR